MMQLQTKYRKQHLLLLKTFVQKQKIQRKQRKNFETFFLQSQHVTIVKFNEYEALRRILSRKLNRLLRFSLRSKPYIMVTAKPREMRMGKGKGAFSHYHIPMYSGRLLAQVGWCQKQLFFPLLDIMRNSLKKSSLRFRFLIRIKLINR